MVGFIMAVKYRECMELFTQQIEFNEIIISYFK